MLDKHLDTAVRVRIDIVNVAIRNDSKLLFERRRRGNDSVDIISVI